MPSALMARPKSLVVKRGCRYLDSVPSVGTSKVIYQVCFMLHAVWSPVLRSIIQLGGDAMMCDQAAFKGAALHNVYFVWELPEDLEQSRDVIASATT